MSKPSRIALPVLALGFCLLASLPASSQCVDYSTYVHPESYVFLGATDAVDVAVSGSYAFVTTLAGGLRVVDATNPSDASLVGAMGTPAGAARGIAVSGAYAYICDGSSGLQIANIVDPAVPSIVGSYNTPGSARGVALTGAYAVVADSSQGLRMIDVSVPSAPTSVGFTDTPGIAQNVAVQGDFAYLADGTAGMQIVKVSLASTPTIVATYNSPGDARDVAVQGDYAYLADATSFRVIDIEFAGSPLFVGSVATSETAAGVAVAGTVAYVAYGNGGLVLIDVSNPAAPAILGSVDSGSFAGGIAVASGRAFLAQGTPAFLTVADVSSNAFVEALGTGFTSPVSLAANGDFVAVGTGDRIQMWDVSDPASPLLDNAIVLGAAVNDIEWSGPIAYLGLPNGIALVEDPASPLLLGTGGAGTAYAVQPYGDCDCVAVAQGFQGLQSLCAIGRYLDTPGVAFDVEVSGTVAVVADGTGGLRFVDLADPLHPALLAAFGLGASTFEAVKVSGTLAYAVGSRTASDPGGFLWVVDFATPAAPTLVSTQRLFGGATAANYGIALDSHYAYVRAEWPGVTVVDIANPADPVVAGGFNTGTVVVDLAVDGGYLYVAEPGNSRFRIFPAHCSAVTAVETPSTQAPGVPAPRFEFLPPVPNPMTGETTLTFRIPLPGETVLEIFDVGGRRVRTLAQGELGAGEHVFRWNGQNDKGHRVASGAYVARLRANGQARSVRVTLTR